VSAFLSVADIDQPPSAYAADTAGSSESSHPTQDPGNLSWIVEASEGRLFIKTAGTDAPPLEHHRLHDKELTGDDAEVPVDGRPGRRRLA
jgi:hypothetical protein